jgi:thiamine pyrophosphokinase
LAAGGGGRIDHIFAIRSLFERDIFPSRWITDTADIRCINVETSNTDFNGADGFSQICCCIDKCAVVSVFPLGAGPWEAKSEGLKWQLEGLSWDRGFFGLSNVAVDGKFSIEAKEGRFMVILPLENKEEN